MVMMMMMMWACYEDSASGFLRDIAVSQFSSFHVHREDDMFWRDGLLIGCSVKLEL